jgi:hypothetical protein
MKLAGAYPEANRVYYIDRWHTVFDFELMANCGSIFSVSKQQAVGGEQCFQLQVAANAREACSQTGSKPRQNSRDT